jgi:hypothetical protein
MKKLILVVGARPNFMKIAPVMHQLKDCLLYTSDAADELDGVCLGGGGRQ